MAKVAPGERLSIAARDWNVLLDVAESARQGLLSTGSGPSGVGAPVGLVLPVKNSTGSAIDRFHAAAISGVIFSPTDNADTFKNQIGGGLTAAAMSSSYFGKFCVFQETVANGSIGRACIHGVTVAQITVGHADHDRVDVDTAGGSKLVSQFYGAGQILYKESGTGTKWAAIRIGEFVAPIVKAIADGSITAGSSGSADIQVAGSDSESVTAYLDWMHGSVDVADNDELLIRFFKDEGQWIIIGAECPA